MKLNVLVFSYSLVSRFVNSMTRIEDTTIQWLTSCCFNQSNSHVTSQYEWGQVHQLLILTYFSTDIWNPTSYWQSTHQQYIYIYICTHTHSVLHLHICPRHLKNTFYPAVPLMIDTSFYQLKQCLHRIGCDFDKTCTRNLLDFNEVNSPPSKCLFYFCFLCFMRLISVHSFSLFLLLLYVK